MTMVHCDGFDAGAALSTVASGGALAGYLLQDYTGLLGGVANFSAVLDSDVFAPGGSRQALRVTQNSNNGGIYKALGITATTGVVGFAFRTNQATTTARSIYVVLDGTSEQISVRLNTSGQLTVSRAGTLLATGTTALTTNTWYYIELKFTINNTTGVVELMLDGVTEIASTTGLNTRATANTQWTGFALWSATNNNSSHYYDDIYVLNAGSGSNTFLGPVSIPLLTVAGNGASADWSPNGGSNSGSVLTDDGDTTFNESSTPGDVDTFAMTDLPAAAGSVFALRPRIVAKRDAGAARTVRPVFRIGGVDYTGTTKAVGTSATVVGEPVEVSPATTSAWTISEVNGLEAGYELVS